MTRTLIISILLLFVAPAAVRAKASETESGIEAPAARLHVEKKYALIDENLKSSAKFRLSYVVASLYGAIRSGKDVDCHAMARAEIGKQFSIATAEQKEALIFHAVAAALKKVEADIEEMRNDNSETSTMFDNLTIRANELFDILTEVFKNLKGLSARTVASIL